MLLLSILNHWDILLSHHNKLYEYIKMKYEVQLYVGGTVFYETVQATNYQDAKETALARNPKAKVISVNAKLN